MKKLGLILLIAAFILTGCATSGRGSVQLLEGEVNDIPLLVPSEATFSFSFACYAQNNNRVEGYLNWNDPTNGVRFSATLPETAVKVFTQGYATTCKELKAAMADSPFYAGGAAYIYNQNDKQVGQAYIAVYEPTLNPPCGDGIATLGTEIEVMATDSQGGYYTAQGCLDRGKIILGSGQNQQ